MAYHPLASDIALVMADLDRDRISEATALDRVEDILHKATMTVSTVYLCITALGYVGAVFDNRDSAVWWCHNLHPQYHVIERPLSKHPSEVK